MWADPENQRDRVDYSYAIHEAYYDNNGHVGAITQEALEVCGEDIEQLRHTWIMMAEAFGLPILDYDQIPEPGYDRKEDPLGSMLDERLKDRDKEWIPWEQVKKDLEAKWGPFDSETYDREREVERLEKERIHEIRFIGTPSLDGLIEKIRADYREWIEEEQKRHR